LIHLDRDKGEFWVERPTAEELSELDGKLQRVAPDVLRWRAPNAPSAPTQMRGAGDLVKRFTDLVGLRQCPPCKKRQEWLNKAIPNPFRSDGPSDSD
jgi:hypothetical protein